MHWSSYRQCQVSMFRPYPNCEHVLRSITSAKLSLLKPFVKHMFTTNDVYAYIDGIMLNIIKVFAQNVLKIHLCVIYIRVRHILGRNWISTTSIGCNGPLTKYAKLRVAHAPGMAGTFCLPPGVSDANMHHGTCVTHVLWCMPVSLTSGYFWSRWWGKKTFPAFPAHAQPAILRIW